MFCFFCGGGRDFVGRGESVCVCANKEKQIKSNTSFTGGLIECTCAVWQQYGHAVQIHSPQNSNTFIFSFLRYQGKQHYSLYSPQFVLRLSALHPVPWSFSHPLFGSQIQSCASAESGTFKTTSRQNTAFRFIVNLITSRILDEY